MFFNRLPRLETACRTSAFAWDRHGSKGDFRSLQMVESSLPLTPERMNVSLSCLGAACTDDFERYQSFGRSMLQCSLGGTKSWMVAFIYVQPGKSIFIPRFLKNAWRSNDFW